MPGLRQEGRKGFSAHSPRVPSCVCPFDLSVTATVLEELCLCLGILLALLHLEDIRGRTKKL